MDREKVTLGVRVNTNTADQMEQVYKKFYVDKSKQIRCLLSYFLSLSDKEQKRIIDFGMQRELRVAKGDESAPV